MIEIRNMLFQPLTLQMKGGAGLHLGPRERRRIAADRLSPEIVKAAKRRLITITELPEVTPAGTPEPTETEPAATDPSDSQSPTTTRKRR